MSLVKEFGFKKKSITDLQLFIDLSRAPEVNFIPILQAAFCANILAPNICKVKL